MHRSSHFCCSYSRLAALVILLALVWAACSSNSDPQRVRPRQLRDVPAQRLAYTVRADTEAPPEINQEEASTKPLPAIQQDFDARRKDDALLRTVTSPDGQRALALYGTIDEPGPTFHIDLYAADGKFLRNLSPPDLAGVFADSVLWSSDGGLIAFVGRKSQKPQPTPTPFEELLELPAPSPLPTALPSPSIAPAFGLVPVFNTEQVYLCNRDGFDLKPLTTREGLIYFALSWAPDNHALAALACRESEWEAREKEFKTPAGRPRIITVDGQERLLDDSLAEAPPAWCPDSSKVATAFGVDVGIYDAASKAPTQARINLREPLLAASTAFDEKSSAAMKKSAATPGKAGNAQPTPSPVISLPASFNPIVRLEWPVPEKLYLETAYVSMRSELIKTFSRWHLITLSAQAAVLDRR
jgi:hypothetical protein